MRHRTRLTRDFWNADDANKKPKKSFCRDLIMDKHKTKCQIAWQKFLYVIVMEIDRKKSDVIVWAAQFELAQSLGHLIPTPQSSVKGAQGGADKGKVIHTLRFQVINCHHVSVLSSTVVENVDRGICHPCILIKALSMDERNGESTSLHLVHLTEAGLKLKGQFQTEQRLLKEDHIHTAQVDIINESVVSIVISSEIHLIRFKDPRKAAQRCTCNLTNVVQKSSSKKIPYSILKILGFKTIHRHNSENIDTFCDMLWLLSVETPKSASHDPINPWELQSPNRTKAVLITLLQDHSYKTNILDGTDFLPNIYGSLVTDLQIISAGENPKKSDAAQPSDGTESKGRVIHMESTLLVMTCSGQLLYFRNGDLKKCMSIESGTGLKMVQFENCIGASYYLLQNDDSIEVVDAQSFEVAERFSNITSIHVADFAGSGGDQVLLVPNQEAHTSPNNWTKFILTDFHSCNIRSSQSRITSEEGTPDSSIQAAVQALEGRLQASVTYVCGVEREFENILRLVEQSVATLKQLALGKEPVQHPQPGLMPLLGEESTAGVGRVGKCQDSSTDTLYASDVWHKVYNDFWCISMVLLNTSKRCLESLKLSLMPQDCTPHQPIESTTVFTQPHLHTLHPSTPSTSDEPTPKLRRLHSNRQQPQHPLVPHWSLEPSGRVQCVIKTAVPRFSSGDARRVTVMASWVENDGKRVGMETGDRGAMEGSDSVYGQGSACCCTVAQVELSTQDVVSGSLHIEPGPSMSADDLLVLDVTQTCYPLTVTRSYSSPGNMPHILQGALGFQRLTDSETCICLQSGCLQHARVKVISQLHISVHVRDESQLFFLVHALYSVLPDDVIILPCHTSGVTTLTTNLLSDITAEIDFVRDNSQNLLVKSNKATIPEVENGDCKKDKITSVRREFAEKQRQVFSAGDATIDERKLEQFQSCLHRLEQRTNKSMGVLSTRIGSASAEDH